MHVRKRGEHKDDREREAIIEAAFHVQSLANLQRHALAGNHSLTESGVGGNENRRENARGPNRELRKQNDGERGSGDDTERHRHRKKAQRKLITLFELTKPYPRSVGKKHDDERKLGEQASELEAVVASERAEKTGADGEP